MRTNLSATAEVRRAQVVEATTRAIARHGLSGTSFTRIAAEAGISSPGLISHHFAGKDEPFTVLTQQLLDACVDTIEEAVGADPDLTADTFASELVDLFVRGLEVRRDG